MKEAKHWIPCVLIGLFFISLIILRPFLLETISKIQQNNLSGEQVSEIEDVIDKSYNYKKNGGKYLYTFLEFGSTGCAACKNMENVMEQIKSHYPDKVQVVFINVMDKSNKDIMNYFGVSVIPYQVLLNDKGEEFFRHSGFISEIELGKHFR